MHSSRSDKPLILHIIFRMEVGGLQNGLVNLVNNLPADLADHYVLSLTDFDPQFASRINPDRAQFIALNKGPGQTAKIYPRLASHIRRLRPAIVHTRNLSTLEAQLVAYLCRVPVRIHGEHGWDTSDLYGQSRRFTRLRRVFRHLIHQQIALSQRTASYLANDVGVPRSKIKAIMNGVDCTKFTAATDPKPPQDWPFEPGDFIIGTTGRLSPVKNQQLLVRAFVKLFDNDRSFANRARLVVVGAGPDEPMLKGLVESSGASKAIWFCGEQSDVVQMLQMFDLFCLPSLAEGLSNAILEAMACALPVIATDVGGNPEIVRDGHCGRLVSSDDTAAMAAAIAEYFHDPALCHQHSAQARQRATRTFGLDTMIAEYATLYDGHLRRPRLLQPLGQEPVGQEPHG